MRLIVHAGPGKTGTTAIQACLRKGSQRLLAQGVLYLGLMLEHAPVNRFAWQRPGAFNGFMRLRPERAQAELLQAFRDTVASAAASGIHTLVLSNESLFRRPAVFIEVLRQLREDGVALSIIAYARRHDELARSSYIQWGLVHKTYRGPLQAFRDWMAGRDLALMPAVRTWRSAFGDDFQLRNFHAAGDVVADFLRAASLDHAGLASARVYETPPANELVLRALFNGAHEQPVPAARFKELFGRRKLALDQPIDRWLDHLLPTRQDLEQAAADLGEDRAGVDAELARQGLPPLPTHPLADKSFEVDAGGLMTAYFQLIVDQAQRIEALEARVSRLEAAPPADLPGCPALADAGVRAALVPALGYFGSLPSDCLEVPVSRSVREIHLEVASDKPTFLNLRGLELLQRGKPIPPSPAWRASQSSTAEDPRNRDADSLLAMRGIHSKGETRPWWRVVFDEPVLVDAIRVWNRTDGWGSRSRFLRVEAVDEAGNRHLLHDGQARALAERSLVAARAMAGLPDAASAARLTRAQALEARQSLLGAIADQVRRGELALADVEWPALVPMLPVWTDAEPSPAEWTLLAAFLIRQQQGRKGTSVKAFSLMLTSQARLRRLQDELNALGTQLGLGRFMLTRHGLKSEGLLRQDPARFMGHLRAVVDALAGLGRAPVLAYGTLLGAIREGDFIAHDDDIDVLYRSRASSREAVEADLATVKAALVARGFKVVDLLPNSQNMHVIDRTGAVIDIFPCWEEEGLLHMHMEGMKLRGIPPRILYPEGEATLLGERFPAPGDPEAFLQERYGEGWRVSDQFFEWPWPLKEEAAA